MPLLDHFHPPLSELRHWESFLARWAGTIVDALEGSLLPKGYFAEVRVHIGAKIEADVGTFRENGETGSAGEGSAGKAVAVAEAVWVPPAPALVFPAVVPDEIEVQIFGHEGGPTLVAAIELLSPRNKDRPPHPVGCKCDTLPFDGSKELGDRGGASHHLISSENAIQAVIERFSAQLLDNRDEGRIYARSQGLGQRTFPRIERDGEMFEKRFQIHRCHLTEELQIELMGEQGHFSARPPRSQLR